MKRIICVLLILIFILSGCNGQNNNPNVNIPLNTGNHRPSLTDLDNIRIVILSFDELILLADAVVIAELISQEAQDFSTDTSSNYCSIFSCFKLESIVFGENIDDEIETWSFGSYLDDNKSDNRRFEHVSTNVYVPGERYVLLLDSFDENKPLYASDKDLYQFEAQYIFLPLSDLSKSHMLDEDKEITSLFNDNITEETLVEYILSVKNKQAKNE